MMAAGMALLNQRTDTPLAERVEVAITRKDRKQGLLGRDGLAPSSALIIAPCLAIHTMFMRFDIDAVFVDAEGRVVKVVEGLTPWRIAVKPSAHAVVEFPSGSVQAGVVRVGDRLCLVDQTGERVRLSARELRGRLY